MRRWAGHCVGGCALLGLCGAVAAGPLPPPQTFSLSNGLQSASAVFAFTPGSLEIVLTNTMTTNGEPNWLTGLFFDIGGPTSPSLTPTGTLVDGSLVTFDGSGPPDDFTAFTPAQLWAFRQGVPDGELPQDAAYALGAAGLDDVFGMTDMLQSGGPSPQPGGTDGGIVPTFGGVTVPPGHFGRPFALGSLTFHFDLPGGFNIADASVENVSFVFGTGFDEIVLVPLPAALPMGLLGLAGVVVLRRLSLKGRKAAA